MALWRETLLAKKVLEGNTKGYRQHPQLRRFQNTMDPLALINLYLRFVLEEAGNRGYAFDMEKVNWDKCRGCDLLIPVAKGQVAFERKHLLSKLKIRDLQRHDQLIAVNSFAVHPIFKLVEGDIEEWEVIVG